MKIRAILTCLIMIQLGTAVQAATAEEDLFWYRSALSFSGFSQNKVLTLMNPLQGPQSHRLGEKDAPWAGNYFPMMDGGIAHRWQTQSMPKKILNQKSYMKLSPEERQKLSPVEKYDALLGLYDFRTTKHEMTFRGPLRDGPEIQDWEGFCNGVRCAGVMLPEPRFSVTRKNPRGEEITFEPADLKALAGASYFYTEKYAQIGAPSRQGKAESQPNAAVFDMVLRHSIGVLQKPFIIDSHLGSEIWNETAVGYRRKVSNVKDLSPEESVRFPNAVKKITVQLTLETLGEIEIKDSNKPTKGKVADGSLLKTLNANYTLFLDESGNAIDGEWKQNSQVRGVDFAWFVAGKGADKDYAHVGGNPHLEFTVIKSLFKESSQPQCKKVF